MPTRNYEYGCREPAQAAEIVRTMDRANRYRNALVAIEHAKRERMREHLLAHAPDWAAAAAECEALEAETEAEAAKSKRGEPAALQETRRRLSEARAREKTQRRAAQRDHRAALKEIQDGAYEAQREARAASGLYWGTYLLVEQAAEEFGRGPPPRYKRWTGDGRIGVQLQGGLPAEAMTAGTDTRLRLTHREPHPDASPRHRDRYRTLWMRTGSDGRSPVWAEIPIIWHRDLPHGAAIKWAVLTRRMLAGRARWNVLLTIDVPDATPADLAATGACGIDMNYRCTPAGGQRIATAYGDDGEEHVLRLGPGMVREWHKCRDIRSIRDRNFDDARSRLVAWTQENGGRELPPWCDLSTLANWKSSRRLAKLVYDWNHHHPPIPGEETILPELEAWRQRENHLDQYETNLRDQLLAARRDKYRNWVATLRRRYRTAYIERMDLREAFHDTLRPKDEQSVQPAQRAAAAFACLSELRGLLANGGATIVEVDPSGTTTTCHACQRPTAIRAATQVRYTCEHCAATWDQDANAARNLLARGEAARESRESLAGEPGEGVAPQSSKRKRVSRSERNAAARNKRSEAARIKRLG